MFKEIYMTFVSRKEYKGKIMTGQEVTIPEGVTLTTYNNIVSYDRLPICHINSQVCKDNFVWADDGFVDLRIQYENIILFDVRIKFWDDKFYGRFSKEEVAYIRNNFPQLVEKEQEALLFNNYFYIGSNIKEIEKIKFEQADRVVKNKENVNMIKKCDIEKAILKQEEKKEKKKKIGFTCVV